MYERFKLPIFVLMIICCWRTISIKGDDGDGNGCPPSATILPCRCSIKGNEMQIWCSHSNLPQIIEGIHSVERNIQRVIDELILENNQLPSLPGRFFGSIKVMRLMLRHNNLERLSNGWLNELEENLVEIFIVESTLRSVPVESLTGMKNLQAITIQSDELKRLPDFSGLINLKYISIQSKLIFELPPNIFRHLPKLENIHINGGQGLNRLESGLFNNLPALKAIDLNRNGINWIHLRSLYRLTNLINLRLSNNQLSDVGMIGRVIKDLENLQKLRLDKNLITSLREGSFVDLSSLRELYLNDNRITEIHYGSFHRIPNLRIVFLQNNHIKRIHPESFLQSSGSGVEILYLQNNEIDRIEELRSLLDALPTLKFLEFSNNYLMEIPFGALHGHGTIEQLHLDNNLIQIIDRDALIAMPALRELRLSNNNLTETLSMPFWNLPGLKGLDLSLNHIKKIDSILLIGLPSLRRLDLSENMLTIVDPNSFLHTPMLETLNISFNEIKTIHPATFRNLNRLFEIDVSHNQMIDMIPGLPKIVERISLRNNHISTLPISASKSFNLPNLRMLDLSNNKIEYIPKYTFQSVNQLRLLNLNQNNLRSIEDSTFLGTSRLEMLHLQDNQIDNIQDRSFELMTNLRIINLQGNKIEVITDNFFINNTKLEQLDLSRNMLKELTSMIFKNLKLLQFLDLSGNLLIDIPNSLSELINLKDIDMSFNRLIFLPPVIIGAWKNVIEIRLSNNQITELKQGTLRNLPNLQYLDLSSNEINSLEPGALRNLPDLQELVLADNKLIELKDHVFENLPSLQAVHLQHNQLRFISPNSFFKSPSLVYLNLSANNFHKMENIGIRSMRNLEVLDISNNAVKIVNTMPLQALNWLVELKLDENRICKIQGAPFETMPRLRVLSLRNNRMREVHEELFRNLRGNLAVLDIEGNPILCSCDMQWFSVWLEETNSPDPGPKCENGKYLRKSRLDKNDCQNLRVSHHTALPLMNEHGDMFARQLSVELAEVCDEDLNDFSDKPLPGESEYFYDQYIDYPINDSNAIMNGNSKEQAQKINPNSVHKNNINNNNNNSSKNKNHTILNMNMYNKFRPPPSESSSPFTFFGYPLPSFNVGKFFGARKVDSANDNGGDGNGSGGGGSGGGSIGNGGSSGGGRGKVRMYHPTSSELEKYLNQETQYHDITSRNRFTEIVSTENNSNEEITSFRTPFKAPTLEKGGFLPILPNQSGGFLPINNPQESTSRNLNKSINISADDDDDIQRIPQDNIQQNKYFASISIGQSSADEITSTTPSVLKDTCINCDEKMPIATTISTNNDIVTKNNHHYSPFSQSIFIPTQQTQQESIVTTAGSITEPIDVSSLEDEEDQFTISSTVETILLIPPPDEQEVPPNYEKYWKNNNDNIKSDIISQTTPIIATDSIHVRPKTRLPSGRSTITKVSQPYAYNSNLPTAEEVFRTTTSKNPDNNNVQLRDEDDDDEDADDDMITKSTQFAEKKNKDKDEDREDESPSIRPGMEWYYENYNKKENAPRLIGAKSNASRIQNVQFNLFLLLLFLLKNQMLNKFSVLKFFRFE